MSYPQGAPGSSGFPPAQQPTHQFSAPTQQFARVPDADPAAEGPSKLPVYLTAATAVLGLLVFLSSFGPQFSVGPTDIASAAAFSGVSFWTLLVVVASLVAGLLAGVSLLPKQVNHTAVAAVSAVLGFLLVLAVVISTPSGVTIDWGLYLVIAFTLLQAAVAVAVLLFDAGVVTAPTPRPKWDPQQQYGQYQGGYYGQPPAGQPPAGQHGGPGQGQRPGYPTPYGGYPGAGQNTGAFPGSGQTTGGFPASAPSGGQSGPPTPPTGYPTYGQPPASNTPTAQVPSQQQGPPSSPSGQSPS